MNNLVYVIKQYQEEAGYLGEPVSIFTSANKAQKECDKLNETFQNDDEHYYEIETFTIKK